MSSKGKFSLKICKSCIMLSTRPRIAFDHKVVLSIMLAGTEKVLEEVAEHIEDL